MRQIWIVLLSAALGAVPTLSGQSTTSKTGATRPATHRTSTARRAAAGCSDMPTLGAGIPKVEGCPKPLYALRYIDTVVGTGAAVTPRKWLTVNYTGYLVDGTKFDSSLGTGPDGKPKEPITFPYGAGQVITGWDTGFEGMNIGGRRRLFIPYELAYGELGRAPIPPKAPLIFDIELVAISDTPPQPKAPPAPPAGTALPPGTVPPTGGTPSNPPGNAIPPTTAPPASKPAPATDPTKPTAIPPTTAPPATTPKPPQ